MERRTFLAMVPGSLLAVPLAAEAQPAGKVWRVGFLGSGFREVGRPYTASLESALRAVGYIENKNISVEYRFPEGQPDRLPQLAMDLAQLPVDVMVCDTNPAVAAARGITRTIPIVMVVPSNPLGAGLYPESCTAGRQYTGLTADPSPETIIGKQLAVLKEAVSRLSHVAVLWNPTVPAYRSYFETAQNAARQLGLTVFSSEVSGAERLEQAFAEMRSNSVAGVMVFVDILTFTHRKDITDLALENRLPTVAYLREFVESGGLISYGVNIMDSYRRAAYYVDRILKGTRPADLPIEQPTTFELFINLKTAKTLDLTIPPSLLQRADHVIE